MTVLLPDDGEVTVAVFSAVFMLSRVPSTVNVDEPDAPDVTVVEPAVMATVPVVATSITTESPVVGTAPVLQLPTVVHGPPVLGPTHLFTGAAGAVCACTPDRTDNCSSTPRAN